MFFRLAEDYLRSIPVNVILKKIYFYRYRFFVNLYCLLSKNITEKTKLKNKAGNVMIFNDIA